MHTLNIANNYFQRIEEKCAWNVIKIVINEAVEYKLWKYLEYEKWINTFVGSSVWKS